MVSQPAPANALGHDPPAVRFEDPLEPDLETVGIMRRELPIERGSRIAFDALVFE